MRLKENLCIFLFFQRNMLWHALVSLLYTEISKQGSKFYRLFPFNKKLITEELFYYYFFIKGRSWNSTKQDTLTLSPCSTQQASTPPLHCHLSVRRRQEVTKYKKCHASCPTSAYGSRPILPPPNIDIPKKKKKTVAEQWDTWWYRIPPQVLPRLTSCST